MSEYIAIEPQYGDDPDVVTIITNLRLAPDGPQSYVNRDEGDEGTPLAQTLFGIDGLIALDIEGSTLVVRRDPEFEWHVLIDEITNALKDFFL